MFKNFFQFTFRHSRLASHDPERFCFEGFRRIFWRQPSINANMSLNHILCRSLMKFLMSLHYTAALFGIHDKSKEIYFKSKLMAVSFRLIIKTKSVRVGNRNADKQKKIPSMSHRCQDSFFHFTNKTFPGEGSRTCFCFPFSSHFFSCRWHLLD